MTVALRAGAATSAGRVRAANEDAVLVAPPLYGVADGMGGHVAGEVASGLAVETVRDAAGRQALSVPALVAMVEEANRAIVSRADADPDLRGMGTTFTALALVEGDAAPSIALVNVGDSRAYVLSAGTLRMLTRDHTYVEELVAAGEITPDEARVHPHRHIITRALGVDDAVRVDAWSLDPVVGDRYLLCSDGLIDEVDDASIAQQLRLHADPKQAAEALVHLANQMGGRDNTTVVVVDVVDGTDEIAPDEAAGTTEIAAAGAAAVTTPAPDVTAAVPVVEAPGAPGAPPGEDATDAAAAAPSGAPAAAPTAAPSAEAALAPDDVGGWLAAPDLTDLGAGPVPPPTRPPDVEEAAPPPPKRRRFTVAAVLFVGLVLAVAAVAVFGIVRAGRSGWFVGFDDGQVALYQGRPEGLLWVDPTVEKVYLLGADDLSPEWEERVARNPTFSSRAAAENWVAALASNPSAVPALATTTTTTTTTLVTTTGPPAVTTTAPPSTSAPGG